MSVFLEINLDARRIEWMQNRQPDASVSGLPVFDA
jgi:hypothetical protein